MPQQRSFPREWPDFRWRYTGHSWRFSFLTCFTARPATGCALAQPLQTIPTQPLIGKPTLASGSEDRVTFAPATKTVLAEISFNEASACAFNGLEAVKGSVKVGLPTGQTEGVVQSFVGLGSLENN